ncbi:MAG: hypothetical protein K1Y36_14070 [Blastocatellia bacterium]|nr:hypothetical protein [Blastocatellia bacterium]
MPNLMYPATVFLMLFGVVAAFDGLYLHLWKYRLHTRAESLVEHRWHTLRVFLFLPVVYGLFYRNSGGWALWLTVILVGIDFGVALLDVLEENQSRASLGGLSSTEYAIHVVTMTLHTVAISLALAARPLAAWSLTAPLEIGPQVSFSTWVALQMLPGNLLIGILHVWLMQPKYRTALTQLQPKTV